MTQPITSPDLVDRSDELALLASAWLQAAAGQPRVVLIRGHAGIGKTRLVTTFESQLQAAHLVLHGSCVRLDAHTASFTPFRSVLGELVDRWDVARVRTLAAGAAAALSPLVPELAESRAVGGDTYDAVARLLDRVSREQSLAVVVEDLHWADAGTLAMVDYLSRALRTSSLLLVTTLRTGPDEQSPADSLVDELVRLPRVDTVDLGPLSDSGVRRLLRGCLGRPPPEPLSDRIARQSRGVPFLVEELAAAEAAGQQGLPDRLRDVLLHRTAGLSGPAATVLRAVAVAGRPVDEPTLRHVCNLGSASTDSALGELRDAALMVFDRTDGTADFRHALLREAVESQLVPGEAARLHRRFAELLDGEPSSVVPPRAVEAVEAADHWWLAGDVAQARRAALAAAERAREVGLYREEWRLLSRVLQLPDVDDCNLNDDNVDDDSQSATAPDRVGLLHEAGRAACNCGEFAAGYAAFDAAVRLLDLGRDPAAALEIVFDLVSRLVGTIPEAVDDSIEDAVRTALASLPDGPSRPRMLGCWALARLALHRGEREEGWDRLHEAIACADTIGDPLQGAGLRVNLAAYYAGSWISGDEGRALYGDARRLAREHADHHLEMQSLINEVDLLEAGLGRYSEAEQVAREMLAVAAGRATPTAMSDMVVGNMAEALLRTGGWAEALDRLAAALEVDRPNVERGGLYMLLAAVLLALGDLPGASAAAEEARERFSGGGTAPQFVVSQAAVEAELALASDRPADAVRVATEAFDAHRRHIWQSRAFALADVAARASRSLPPQDRPTAWLNWAVELFRQDESDAALHWWPPVLVAEISDDVDDWEAALRAVTDAEVPVLVGLRTRLGTATARLRAGRRDRGAALLGEVAEKAAALHARAVSEDVAGIERRFLLPPRSETSARPAVQHQLASLTPRELQVLRLVAAGHSNGRIAAELFISVKTVSVHVSHILEKLEVRSRGEAAAVAWRHGLTVPGGH